MAGTNKCGWGKIHFELNPENLVLETFEYNDENFGEFINKIIQLEEKKMLKTNRFSCDHKGDPSLNDIEKYSIPQRDPVFEKHRLIHILDSMKKEVERMTDHQILNNVHSGLEYDMGYSGGFSEVKIYFNADSFFKDLLNIPPLPEPNKE